MHDVVLTPTGSSAIETLLQRTVRIRNTLVILGIDSFSHRLSENTDISQDVNQLTSNMSNVLVPLCAEVLLPSLTAVPGQDKHNLNILSRPTCHFLESFPQNA